MRNIILLLLLLPFISNAQNKLMAFAAAQFDKRLGASLVLNSQIKLSNISIGAGAEIMDVEYIKEGGVATFLDAKSYYNIKKSSLFSFAQAGYNNVNYKYEFFNNSTRTITSITGGPFVAVGVGYNIRFPKTSIGPFLSLKIRTANYKTKVNNVKTSSVADTKIVAALGISI